jgi:pilus assembly protein CpaB
MPNRNVIIIAVAVLLGLVAVVVANAFFSGVEQRQEQIAQEQQMARIVVASQEMAFGAPLNSSNTRLVNWPANSVPTGAFTSLEEATRNRVVLRPIVVGEPILASKVSGADGRATISANLPKGQFAYAVPIGDASGVGGFVRPGDVVDVVLTRQIPGEGATASDKMADIVLSAVPVLGIDQVADEKNTNPAVGKTATLQVDTMGAQKLALATQMGVLSLALRNVADQDVGFARTVTGRDLSNSRLYIPAKGQGGGAVVAPQRVAYSGRPASASLPPRRSGPSMTVVRGGVATDYEVQSGR